MRLAWLAVVAACGSPDATPQRPVVPVDPPPAIAPDAGASLVIGEVDEAPPDAKVDLGPEVWLRGSTHVHAKPSGDSTTPIPDVIAWYETRGYDFIVLTDHNRVSEIDGHTDGHAWVRADAGRMLVLAGIELTHNPTGCLPPGDSSGRCRIHVNLLGVTRRFDGKLEWADRTSNERVDKYQAALDQRKQLGGVAQLNHPQWYWGMTPELLVELAHRGFTLVEIANKQFATWNAGDPTHPSMEALWDKALVAGAMLWGVASDDAHQYDEPNGKYPAGGAWVVVKAHREAQAILDALEAGRFYASTGVVLERAEVVNDELVVDVAKDDPGTHIIEFVENGQVVARVTGTSAHRAVPPSGYVRATVVRGDGKKAWIQPARR